MEDRKKNYHQQNGRVYVFQPHADLNSGMPFQTSNARVENDFCFDTASSLASWSDSFP